MKLFKLSLLLVSSITLVNGAEEDDIAKLARLSKALSANAINLNKFPKSSEYFRANKVFEENEEFQRCLKATKEYLDLYNKLQELSKEID